MAWTVRVLLLAGLAAAGAASSAAAADTALWWPDPGYPVATVETAPDWLTREVIAFSRWDGGPIETCKGFLSGWTYFNPPWPAVLDATTRWYDPQTIELAEAMGHNFLWLTLSVGFSVEREQVQWEQLRPYVQTCHQRGIKVAAYMSLTNLFVDDMFATVPESKDWLLLDGRGKPVPYGAAAYEKMGRTTRMLADVSRPEWRAYLKRRVDAAVDLGFDAIEYDNSFFRIGGDERAQQRYDTFLEKNGLEDNNDTRMLYEQEQIRRTYLEMLAHARQRKPDMAVFCNAHWSNIHISCGNTLIATEDGVEPGYYDEQRTTEYKRIERDDQIPPVYEDLRAENLPTVPDPAALHQNLALLRTLKGLSDGWKPVLVEYGRRRNGNRFMNQMPPLAFQLAVGECNAALCSLQAFQEGLALLDLYRRKPKVMHIVEAASEARRFVENHQRYILGARYKADVAVVLDERMKGRELLECLARKNVQYAVLFDDEVCAGGLDRFQRVLVYEAKLMSDEALAALVAYAKRGGRLLVVGSSGAKDRWGQPRPVNPLDADEAWTHYGLQTSGEELAGLLADGLETSLEMGNAPYVLFTLTEGAGTTPEGFVAHLLNYRKRPVENLHLRCAEDRRPVLHALTPGCDAIAPGNRPGEWVIPRLGVYSLVVLDK